MHVTIHIDLGAVLLALIFAVLVAPLTPRLSRLWGRLADGIAARSEKSRLAQIEQLNQQLHQLQLDLERPDLTALRLLSHFAAAFAFAAVGIISLNVALLFSSTLGIAMETDDFGALVNAIATFEGSAASHGSNSPSPDSSIWVYFLIGQFVISISAFIASAFWLRWAFIFANPNEAIGSLERRLKRLRDKAPADLP